jgi:hypothetical protein
MTIITSVMQNLPVGRWYFMFGTIFITQARRVYIYAIGKIRKCKMGTKAPGLLKAQHSQKTWNKISYSIA